MNGTVKNTHWRVQYIGGSRDERGEELSGDASTTVIHLEASRNSHIFLNVAGRCGQQKKWMKKL